MTKNTGHLHQCSRGHDGLWADGQIQRLKLGLPGLRGRRAVHIHSFVGEVGLLGDEQGVFTEAFQAKVGTRSRAPAFPGRRRELGFGAGAAVGGLQWRGKISAGLPAGEGEVILIEAKGGPLCSAGGWTPVGFLT